MKIIEWLQGEKEKLNFQAGKEHPYSSYSTVQIY